MKKDKNEKENLPAESEKKNNAITEKVKDVGKRIGEWRLERNVVFSEPLTPKAPEDETAPLKREE